MNLNDRKALFVDDLTHRAKYRTPSLLPMPISRHSFYASTMIMS